MIAAGLIPYGIAAFLARNRSEWKTIYSTEYDLESEWPPGTKSGENWDDCIVDQHGFETACRGSSPAGSRKGRQAGASWDLPGGLADAQPLRPGLIDLTFWGQPHQPRPHRVS